MTDEPIKEDPVKKFRKLIASFMPLKKEAKETASALVQEEAKKQTGKDVTASLPKRSADNNKILSVLPQKGTSSQKFEEIKAVDTPKPAASKPDLKTDSAPKSGFTVWGPRLWTTASVITLTFNIIVAIVLLILLFNMYRMRASLNQVMGLLPSVVDLPGGLYENFEKMERANIQTNVVVEAVIPVKFDLQLNQQTNVILSQDVTITNALVTVNTGGLNISRANTTIVLPAGTTLPVNLSLTVPVDQQVPVTLNVPVNIPLKDTQLRDPFVGLQNVIKPLYCFLEPQAVNMDNQFICQ
ncbi:MAG: hypothetical protein HXY38_13220 [Chloroflexi bacterium]|nr:hypothetical protein [Chloroflexota bacterium]